MIETAVGVHKHDMENDDTRLRADPRYECGRERGTKGT
jgi:hypothetical protein